MGWDSKEYREERAKAEKLERFLEKHLSKGYMKKDDCFLIIGFTFENMQSIKGSLTIEIYYYVQKPVVDYEVHYKNLRHRDGASAGTFEELIKKCEPLKKLIDELEKKELLKELKPIKTITTKGD